MKNYHIYVTEAVKCRLSEYFRLAELEGLTFVQQGERIGVSPGTLCSIKKGKEIPMLDLYLKLCREYKFDLSRDVNAIYARRQYSIEFIKRRIARVIPIRKKGEAIWACLTEAINYANKDIVSASMQYKPKGRLTVFATALMYIKRKEIEQGHIYPLDLED